MVILKRNKLLFIALSVLFLFSCFYFISTLSNGKESAEKKPASGYIDDTHVQLAVDAKSNIKIDDFNQTEFPNQIDSMGKISIPEDRISVISSRVSGRVESVMVNSGESVQKGQVVARIFSPDFASTREEYLQSLNQQSSDFKVLASMSRKKLKLLGLTDEEVNNLAHSDPNYLTVRSVVSGFILDKKILPGNSVSSGDTLFTVGNFEKVWFSGDIYQEDSSKIHKGQEVIIDGVTGTDEVVRGKISFVSPVIDPATRTIKIRVLMDNAKGILRADMYIQAHIILNMSKAILVPSNAVLQFDGRNYVFIQSPDADNEFERVEVEIAGKYRDKIVVKSGLSGSGKIVSDGALLLNAILKNGVKITK